MHGLAGTVVAGWGREVVGGAEIKCSG
jgi:hypothetical protein